MKNLFTLFPIPKSHIPQRSGTYIHTHTHTHTSTILYLSVMECNYCFISVSYCCLMRLLSVAVVNFHTNQLKLYRYSNTCCVVPCMAFIDVLQCVTFFTPLHFCIPLLYLSPCSPYPSPHTPVESRTVQRPTAITQHSTARICCTAMYRNFRFQLTAVY